MLEEREEVISSKYDLPHVEIKYYNYMHLRAVLMKSYPASRSRFKIIPTKMV